MKKTFYTCVKRNFEQKNFNIEFYEELFDKYLHSIRCSAYKCEKLYQFRKCFELMIEGQKDLRTIKDKNEEVFFHVLHDIKSPILSVKFALESSLRNELDEEIYRINSDVLETIQNFLTVYKFEKAQKNVVFSEFDIIELIDSQIMVHLYFAKENNVRIDFKKKNDKICITSERNVLKRIISNLINNAVKYAKENTKISIKLSSNSTHLKMSISNYAEIDNEDIEALFEKFNTNGDDTSFGLGLYICKRLSAEINCQLKAIKKKNYITFELMIPL